MAKENKRVWPADAVERRKVADLVPYARNARVHSEEQVGQIAHSIEAFGFTVPVLCDEDGQIIAGHGRVMAAEKLGLAEAPVMVARGWSEAEKRAYRIADNKIAMNSDWDNELLRLDLSKIAAVEFDLSLTGFSSDEIDAMMMRAEPPPEFRVVDEDLPTEYQCPKCGYRWSGKREP